MDSKRDNIKAKTHWRHALDGPVGRQPHGMFHGSRALKIFCRSGVATHPSFLQGDSKMNRILVDNPKPPFSLYRKDKGRYKTTLTKNGGKIWVCGECGILHISYSIDKDDPKDRAAKCCKQKYCDCGNKIEKYYTGSKCNQCSTMESYKIKVEKAVEIESCDGPIFCDNSDRYWRDMDDFMDWLVCEVDNGDSDSLPTWVFPCDIRSFGRIDAGYIVANELEEHHEDAEVDDIEELQQFLDKWCDKQSLESWNPDYTRKISVEKVLAQISLEASK